MKKLQNENDIKHHRNDNKLAKNFYNELGSQNMIESGFDRLESLKREHKNEIENLKSLLFKQNKDLSSKDLDLMKACQTSVNSSVLKLKERLFTIDEV